MATALVPAPVPARRRRRRPLHRRVNWSAVFAVLVLAFVLLPILVVAVFSFDAGGRATFPIEGLTLRWYTEAVEDPVMRDAAVNSAVLALVAAGGAVVLGTLAAFAFARYRVWFAGAFLALILLPVVVPHLLLGVALLSFFDFANVRPGLSTAMLAHVLLTLPFVVVTVMTRLAGLDPSYEEAAATLGANRRVAFQKVTLPLLAPTIVGSALLVIGWSLDDFVLTFFTIGSDNTLPIVIWGQMRAGVSPTVNAVSTMMLAATVTLVLVVSKLARVRLG